MDMLEICKLKPIDYLISKESNLIYNAKDNKSEEDILASSIISIKEQKYIILMTQKILFDESDK